MNCEIDHRYLEDIEAVQFGIYSKNQILDLSALEITNEKIFDESRQPIDGGLYDRRMGPNEPSDSCLTCHYNKHFCYGHYGHIKLSLPVYNPHFHRHVLELLKITCLNCHMFAVPESDYFLFIYKMKAIQYGLSELIPELNSFLKIDGKELDFKSHIQMRKKDIAEIFNKAVEGKSIIENNKHIAKWKKGLIKKFIKKSIKYKKCSHCHSKQYRPAKVNGQYVVKGKDMKDGVHISANFNLNASHVKAHLRDTYKNHKQLFDELDPILKYSKGFDQPTDIFFIEYLLVAPNSFRQINMVKGQNYESHRTQVLQSIISTSNQIADYLEEKEAEDDTKKSKFENLWRNLQSYVDLIYDSNLNKKVAQTANSSSGIKQVMEGKEGILRRCVMAKRVNFCARSVIAPDPLIEVDEIGIPLHFALRLTFPEELNDTNKEYLKQLIINGANNYPGARYVEINGIQTNLVIMDDEKRKSYAQWFVQNSSETTESQQGTVKKVLRHMINGDYVLVNRQPTLHKPSIMAQRVRVLRNQKTLRLHYSNCKSYNADFDGDELNIHFPQSLQAKAEAYQIAGVQNQYLSPKDGSPLGGLIQDFIVCSTRMTLRGSMFTKNEYERLVFAGLYFLKKEIKFLPPAYIKPKKLWTGKQIFSTLILNLIPENRKAPNLEAETKVDDSLWIASTPKPTKAGGAPLAKNDMSESYVIIRQGELMTGIVDKAMIGASSFGIVHLFQELYGGEVSSRFISATTFMLTCYLTCYGFSLELEDFLLKPSAAKKRLKILKKSGEKGAKAYTEYLALPQDVNKEEIESQLRARHYVPGSKLFKDLDGKAKKETEGINKAVAEVCFPNGLMKKFPENNLQTIIQTGAKGSKVNAQQISCLLGQIELEGKRVPTMITGASLPSFREYDSNLSAGGFVTSSFASSISPTEFFFHSMAGREGLCDTAVKTAVSGYLQRSLIKHLESLYVAQDLSVRERDGCLIQTLYGGDGLDVTKSQMLSKNKISLLAQNFEILNNAEHIEELKKHPDSRLAKKAMKKNLKKIRREESNVDDPVLKKYNLQTTLGCISEQLEKDKNTFINDNPTYIGKDGELYYSNGKKAYSKEQISDLVHYKALRSQIEPGEHVGILAAQSIGEPSTQMTLNTFHFAGRGDMNVTLGIPRLNEILKTASKNISTPSMDLFLQLHLDKDSVSKYICKQFTKIKLSDIIHALDINAVLSFPNRNRCIEYTIDISILPKDDLEEYEIKFKHIFKHLTEDKFLKELETFISKRLKMEKKDLIKEHSIGKEDKMNAEEEIFNDDAADEESEDEGIDGKGRQTTNYDSGEEEEEKIEDDMNDEEMETNVEEEDLAYTEGLEKLEENKELKELVKNFKYIEEYTFDKENYSCKMVFRFSEEESHFDFETLFVDFVKFHVIRHVPNITKAFAIDLIDSTGQKVTGIRTEGENLNQAYRFAKFLDLDELYSNNIHSLYKKYGIEVARNAIFKEVKSVFAMYGIVVNARHIGLIADYMTSSSRYKAFNRIALANSASIFQQMTFETSMEFLSSNLLLGNVDTLNSVSSRIAFGQLIKQGTVSKNVSFDTVSTDLIMP